MIVMPTIHELHVGSPDRPQEAYARLDERVGGDRIRVRRRWVIRSSMMLLLTAVTLFVLVTWRRDKIAATAQLDRLEPVVKALQESVHDLHELPSAPPEVAGLKYYAPHSVRSYAKKTTEPVVIGSTPKVNRFLHEDGRGVIIYEDGTLRSSWLSESQFLKMMADQAERVRAFEQEIRSRPPDLP